MIFLTKEQIIENNNSIANARNSADYIWIRSHPDADEYNARILTSGQYSPGALFLDLQYSSEELKRAGKCEGRVFFPLETRWR